jgi:hypothetical protein
MIRRTLLAASLLAAPAAAQDFSAGSEAKPWDLYPEVPAKFEAKVVDPLCELAGDCPADCGGGKRQLALLRSVDGVMVLPLKNSQPLFTGGATELQPFCGKTVEVDGLLLVDPDIGLNNVYQVQTIREAGSDEKIKANRWTTVWAQRFPEADAAAKAAKEPWFRFDPRIQADIAENGYFGLGRAVDEEQIKLLFP